eukprot:3101913-Rhodomonas_salina.3
MVESLTARLTQGHNTTEENTEIKLLKEEAKAITQERDDLAFTLQEFEHELDLGATMTARSDASGRALKGLGAGEPQGAVVTVGGDERKLGAHWPRDVKDSGWTKAGETTLPALRCNLRSVRDGETYLECSASWY